MAMFQIHSYNTFQDPVTDGQTGGRTESNAYEPTVQYAEVGSK